MADYFDEMGWTPLGQEDTPSDDTNHLIQIARFLRDSGMWEFINERESLPPAAAKEAVKNLPKIEFKANSEKSEQCPVCIREFVNGTITVVMPCNHTFHQECIEPWLEKTNSCPLCRHELPTDDEDYESFKKAKKRAVEREKDLEVLHNSMFS